VGRYQDAESLLIRVLELVPSFSAARQNYAQVLHRQADASGALREVERLLARIRTAQAIETSRRWC